MKHEESEGPSTSRKFRKDSSYGSIDIRTVLVNRISSQAPSVSEVTMELFNCFFEVGGSYVLNNLVIRNMVNFNADCSRSLGSNTPDVSEISRGPDTSGVSSLNPNNPTKSFLENFANAPRPSKLRDGDLISFDVGEEGDEDLVFAEYLTDAHKQYVSSMAQYWSISDHNAVVQNFADGTASLSSAKSRTIGKPEISEKSNEASSNLSTPTKKATFYEGLFLSTLLDKLESMLDHSLNENLVLTGLWSQLAQCPHPRVYTYLFSMKSDKASEVNAEGATSRSFLRVLRGLWSEARETLNNIPDGENILISTRRRLGVSTDSANASVTDDSSDFITETNDMAVDDDNDIATMSNKTFFEGMVVLEEFLKEIAGILRAREELNMLT